jgi:hypothetical protein
VTDKHSQERTTPEDSPTLGPFRLEEYRFAKEKIGKNEERRYQMIALNVTGFAAILALSDKIAGWVVPLALVILVSICSRLYTSQSLRQQITTAFVIEVYETPLTGLSYERGQVAYGESTVGRRSRIRTILSTLFSWLTDPFILMLFAGLVPLLVQRRQIAVDTFASGSWVPKAFYVGVFILGSGSVLIDIRRRNRVSLDHYRDWWRCSERRPQGGA